MDVKELKKILYAKFVKLGDIDPNEETFNEFNEYTDDGSMEVFVEVINEAVNEAIRKARPWEHQKESEH